MANYLFVCIENSNRSQMAEAFAHIHGTNNVKAFSAGSRPSGMVNPRAIRSMSKVGYDLSEHKSVSLDELPDLEWDYIVSMGCGEKCPWLPAKQRIEWDIPDPKAMEEEEFDAIRDRIERLVIGILDIPLK